MKSSLLIIAFLFLILSPFLFAAYAISQVGANPSGIIIGAIAGLGIGILIGTEYSLKSTPIGTITRIALGLFCGYLLGSALMLPVDALSSFFESSIWSSYRPLAAMIIYLVSIYFGVTFALRANEEFQFLIPFVKLDIGSKRKKDILIDASTLLDTRIVDLANTGLLDNHLIIPQFILAELNAMCDQGDEHAKNQSAPLL